ncbi:sugar phosphate nucleotidyltransferase [Ectobacillus sp. sgz5001026]|uniref:sugar phosphate nucleotidyltransferase n=1 Tax=Ectobacillus sp. sgz5001026 TaxID=3242473 RepID=UPI0036D2F5F9
MKGVILAGGKGTRLRPLTCHLPKPLLPLLDKPVMEYSIELLKKHGISEIAVTVQYLSSSIQQYFGDGSKWGVKLYYFVDSPPLGTAGSIKQAEQFLDEPFVVISGDALTDIDLSKGIDFHKSGDRLVTIFQKEVSNPLNFGLVVTDEEGRVIKYVEKPSWHEVVSNTVNTGIYIMDPEIFSYMQQHTFLDFSHDVFPALLQKKERIYGYLCNGYWLDIGTFPQYRQANVDILNKKVDVSLSAIEVLPSVWMGKEVDIEEGTMIQGPVFIGDNVKILGGVNIEPHTVIGANSVVGEYAHMKKSILWSDVHIGRKCELTESIIASHAVIEEGSSLFEKSVVADYCRLGKQTIVKSKVKIWPGKVIDTSTVLVSTVSYQMENSSSLFSRGNIIGKANLDITPEKIMKIAAAYGSTLSFHSTVLVGSNQHPYSQLIKQLFISSIQAYGIHTLTCQETNKACFRYEISSESVNGGIFIYMQDSSRDPSMILSFYDQCGNLLSTRKEKEIETAYITEATCLPNVQEIGKGITIEVQEMKYVKSILQILNTRLIKKERFHLLINKLNSSFHDAVLTFFQELDCNITWIYSTVNEDHMKSLIQSSYAHMGIVFREQGNGFELYDSVGNVYTSMDHERVRVPQILLQRGEGSYYPLTIKRGSGFITCYVEEESISKEDSYFKQDALFQIGKLLEIMASHQLPLYDIFKNYPQFHLLRDEVVCPWMEKGKVMRKLLDDVPKQELEVLEGIKCNHENNEWSYIVSDSEQPKIIVYSHSLNPAIAKEQITNLIEKIRRYQKV